MTTHTAARSATGREPFTNASGAGLRRAVLREIIQPLARSGFAVLFLLCHALGQGVRPQQAPVNAMFAHPVANSAGIQTAPSVSTHALGHRQSPLAPVSRALRGTLAQAQARSSSALPSSYDLRPTGRLSPIKNQGACGSCWAFAATGSLESGLLPGESWSFSENNLKNTHGFDVSPCSGGNVDMAAAYLARWPGPITEADDPYQPLDYNNSPSGLVPRKHVQDITYIAPRSGALDNDALKQAVITYGAVSISLSWDDTWYNATYHSYDDPSISGANHEVAIVGWDDNFDRTHFNNVPAGNGAFIARNSWGSAWGEAGYFYISYYDANAGMFDNSAAFYGSESTSNWSRVYQYDPLGWTGSYGYGADTAWFANVFTAQANESISAVSFYVNSPNSPYVIQVYTGGAGSPVSGTLGGTTTGTVATPGYHTIHLAAPVPVNAGARFSVVVRLQTPGYNYPIAAEIPYAGYSSAATAAAGQSFTSPDGSNWSDMNSPSLWNVNVCLKAFAAATAANPSPNPPPPPSPPAPTPSTPSRIGGDFDGNNVPDLVWQNESTRQVVVWYMGGTGGASRQSWSWLYGTTGAAGWHVVAVADFDGNGVPDLVWQNDTTRQATVHYYGGGGGSTDLGWNWLYSSPVPGWHIVGAADFDGNGVPDLVWQNDSTRQVVIHYYGGTGGATDLGWNWLYPGMDAAGWHVAAVADFNRDGVPDLVWQNDSTRQVTVHYYSGPGGAIDTAWAWLWPASVPGWRVAAALDFSGDGTPDLIWQNDASGQAVVHYHGGALGLADLGWAWIISAQSTPWTIVN